MINTVPCYKVFKNCFTVVCIIIALYFCILCIHSNILDEDTSSVNFKNFHSDRNSLYPSVSLCFGHNIFDRNLGDQFKEEYQDFLSACDDNDDCVWNASFADTVYDNVKSNLEKLLIFPIKQAIRMSTGNIREGELSSETDSKQSMDIQEVTGLIQVVECGIKVPHI